MGFNSANKWFRRVNESRPARPWPNLINHENKAEKYIQNVCISQYERVFYIFQSQPTDTLRTILLEGN